MSDLWTFRGVSTAVAAGVFNMLARQLRVAIALISLDKGMVAKIWDIELEGKQIGDMFIEYTLDDTAVPIVWRELKRVRHPVATVAERLLLRSRPITIDAKNDTTALRFSWEDAAADTDVMYLTVTIEFDDMHIQKELH